MSPEQLRTIAVLLREAAESLTSGSPCRGPLPDELDGSAYMLDDYCAGMRQATYADSTPHLHIGDSAFEDWFQQQPFACQPGIKQIARDAYAAGMGDPLVVAKT